LHYPIALAAQLAAAQQALSEEKTARSRAIKALAEAKQTLKDYNADKAKLSQALKTTKDTYTVTRDNLASKSKELDDAVIQEQEANTMREQAEAKLTDTEKRLVVAKGENKDQGLLVEMARQALSKCENSSVLMISTAMVNAMALLKSHLPDLDVELLRKDFTVDETECEVLTNGAYDATHEFASSYDFSSLAEFEDNDCPRNM
jgi:chromosome segregation ATPase